MSSTPPGSEVELKLLLKPCDIDRFLQADLFGAEKTTVQTRTIYFDTPEMELASAGFILRIRASGGTFIQTVKAAGSSAVGLSARPEWERPVSGFSPQLDDAKPILQAMGDRLRLLTPVFEARVERTAWIVQENGSVCEVVFDHGLVQAGDRQSPVCEIELELKSGTPGDLFGLARKIDAVVPVWPGVLTKAERGHWLLGPVRQAVKSERAELSGGLSTAVAFQRIAAACLRQFQLNELQIAANYPAALHQARVGLRRLRSMLSLHKAMLADGQFEEIQADMRWLAGALGLARDLDVLVGRLDGSAYLEAVENARRAAYDTVLEDLASPRARHLLLTFSAWLSFGDWLTNADTEELRLQPVRESSVHALERLNHKIRKDGDHLERLEPEARHAVRKKAKKLRYAAEFYAPLFDDKRGRKRRKRFFDALEAMQDKLGLLNDIASIPRLAATLSLGDAFIAEVQAGADTPVLMDEATKAHKAFADAKPFWA